MTPQKNAPKTRATEKPEVAAIRQSLGAELRDTVLKDTMDIERAKKMLGILAEMREGATNIRAEAREGVVALATEMQNDPATTYRFEMLVRRELPPSAIAAFTVDGIITYEELIAALTAIVNKDMPVAAVSRDAKSAQSGSDRLVGGTENDRIGVYGVGLAPSTGTPAASAGPMDIRPGGPNAPRAGASPSAVAPTAPNVPAAAPAAAPTPASDADLRAYIAGVRARPGLSSETATKIDILASLIGKDGAIAKDAQMRILKPYGATVDKGAGKWGANMRQAVANYVHALAGGGAAGEAGTPYLAPGRAVDQFGTAAISTAEAPLRGASEAPTYDLPDVDVETGRQRALADRTTDELADRSKYPLETLKSIRQRLYSGKTAGEDFARLRKEYPDLFQDVGFWRKDATQMRSAELALSAAIADREGEKLGITGGYARMVREFSDFNRDKDISDDTLAAGAESDFYARHIKKDADAFIRELAQAGVTIADYNKDREAAVKKFHRYYEASVKGGSSAGGVETGRTAEYAATQDAIEKNLLANFNKASDTPEGQAFAHAIGQHEKFRTLLDSLPDERARKSFLAALYTEYVYAVAGSVDGKGFVALGSTLNTKLLTSWIDGIVWGASSAGPTLIFTKRLEIDKDSRFQIGAGTTTGVTFSHDLIKTDAAKRLFADKVTSGFRASPWLGASVSLMGGGGLANIAGAGVDIGFNEKNPAIEAISEKLEAVLYVAADRLAKNESPENIAKTLEGVDDADRAELASVIALVKTIAEQVRGNDPYRRAAHGVAEAVKARLVRENEGWRVSGANVGIGAIIKLAAGLAGGPVGVIGTILGMLNFERTKLSHNADADRSRQVAEGSVTRAKESLRAYNRVTLTAEGKTQDAYFFPRNEITAVDQPAAGSGITVYETEGGYYVVGAKEPRFSVITLDENATRGAVLYFGAPKMKSIPGADGKLVPTGEYGWSPAQTVKLREGEYGHASRQEEAVKHSASAIEAAARSTREVLSDSNVAALRASVRAHVNRDGYDQQLIDAFADSANAARRTANEARLSVAWQRFATLGTPQYVALRKEAGAQQAIDALTADTSAAGLAKKRFVLESVLSRYMHARGDYDKIGVSKDQYQAALARATGAEKARLQQSLADFDKPRQKAFKERLVQDAGFPAAEVDRLHAEFNSTSKSVATSSPVVYDRSDFIAFPVSSMIDGKGRPLYRGLTPMTGSVELSEVNGAPFVRDLSPEASAKARPKLVAALPDSFMQSIASGLNNGMNAAQVRAQMADPNSQIFKLDVAYAKWADCLNDCALLKGLKIQGVSVPLETGYVVQPNVLRSIGMTMGVGVLLGGKEREIGGKRQPPTPPTTPTNGTATTNAGVDNSTGTTGGGVSGT